MKQTENKLMQKPPTYLKIIAAILFIIILYGGFLLITYAFVETHDTKMKLIHYFIPLIILGGTGLLVLVSKFIANILFTLMYTFFGFVLAMELYMFICAVIFLIINACVNLPIYVGYIIILGIPIIICVYGIINVFVTKIEEHSFKVKHLEKEKVRIVHLSDLHLGAVYQKGFTEKIVKKVIELKPDVVVITGDLCDGTMQVLGDWLSPFDILTVPVLYITGNHEQIHGKDLLLRAIETTNIKHIGHEVVEICGINFIGVDFEYDLKKRLTELAPKYKNSTKPNVLLCHIPTMKPEELEEYHIYLFLAGHTHGGQVFPMQLPAYCANACFAGLYSNKTKTNHVYVSTGIGASVVPMRIGSRSVIGVLTFEREEGQEVPINENAEQKI